MNKIIVFAAIMLLCVPAFCQWDSFDDNSNYNYDGSGQNANSAATMTDETTTYVEGTGSCRYEQTWGDPSGAGPWRNRCYYTDTYTTGIDGTAGRYLGIQIYGDASGISFAPLIRSGSTSAATGTYRLFTPVEVTWTGWQTVEWEYVEADTAEWPPVPSAFTASPDSYTVNSLWFTRGTGNELSADIYLDDGYTSASAPVEDWYIFE